MAHIASQVPRAARKEAAVTTRRLLFLIALVGAWAPSALLAADNRLAEAAGLVYPTAVRALLRARADVNAPDTTGTTALHWAVWPDNLANAEELIRAGATVTAANAFRVTPIYVAAEHANAAIVKRLLDAG